MLRAALKHTKAEAEEHMKSNYAWKILELAVGHVVRPAFTHVAVGGFCPRITRGTPPNSSQFLLQLLPAPLLLHQTTSCQCQYGSHISTNSIF